MAENSQQVLQIKPKIKKYQKLTGMNKVFLFSFMVIPIIHFLLFYVYVNINGFLIAFQVPSKTGGFTWSFDQFTRVFNEFSQAESELGIAFKNTFITFGFSLILFFSGVFVAYFLYKKIWFYKAFRIVFYLPNIISSLVTVYVFTTMVSSRGFIPPIVQKLLNLDELPSLLADSAYANWTVIMHMIWLGIPSNMIMWGGTFSRIPTSVLEYGRLDGVGWFRELVQLILPLVWPTFSMLLMMQFTGMFSASGSVFLLTGGKWKTQTLSNWFYMQVYDANGSATTSAYNYMAAFGLLISVPAIAISLFIRFFLTKFVPDVEY